MNAKNKGFFMKNKYIEQFEAK
ncbi:50S ribosomal protein L19, partial [Campylobacter jejuni]|nr:50S ribosomal protein L19 [Campylobacter jejuni]